MGSRARTIARTVKYTLLFILCAAIVMLLAITFFEQPLPSRLLLRITDELSSEDWLVSADSASFSLSYGMKVRNLRVLDRKKAARKPVLSADIVDVEMNIFSALWSREDLLRHVTLTGLKYPRLGDGYYIPDSIEFPGQPDFREKNEPLSLNLPTIHPFGLTLVRPEILDVTPKSVEIANVAMDSNGMTAHGINLLWGDSDVCMSLEGYCELNLADQMVKGLVKGQARQHNIRPMLVALDITNSYAFIDSFTRVEPPVDASCAFDVNLRNNDLHILLDLHPTGGRYNNVSLKNADGKVDIRVFVRDTFQNARIVVGPVTANLADGRSMDGTVIYENTNDIGYVDFDVRSNTSLSNALAVADVLTDGTFDCLSMNAPPLITLKGRMAVDPAHAAANDLLGRIKFDKGSLFSIPLRSAESLFHLKGTDVTFSEASAITAHGGDISESALLSFL